MSNKKHKNKRQPKPTYNTIRNTQEAYKKPANKEKRASILITIALITAIIATAFLSFVTIDPFDWFKPTFDAKQQYLQDKYGLEFEYAFTDYIQHCDVYTTEQYPAAQVAVYDTAIMLTQYPDLKEEWYTHQYADNGYHQIYADKILEYYRPYISQHLDEYRAFIDYSNIAFPSHVGVDTNYREMSLQYRDLLSARLYIVTQNTLSDEEVSAIKESFESQSIPIRLSIGRTPDDIDISSLDMPTIKAEWQQFDITLDTYVNYFSEWDWNDVSNYLQSKYGVEAKISNVQTNQCTVQYKDFTFTIYKTKSLSDNNLNETFTKDFVDDGWIQVNSASINKHYKNIINAESIDSTVFVVPQLQAMPSDINPEDTIKDVTTKYPDILNPLIFILIDKDTIPEEYAQIQNKLQALNESMTVCVLSMDKDTQKTVTKDELLGLWYTGTNVLADTQYTKTELPKSNTSDTTEINDDDSQKAA